MRRWSFIGCAGVIALLVIGSFALSSFPGGLGGGITSNPARGITDPELVSGRPVADSGAPIHLSVGQGIAYSTSPPDSGNHWTIWAQCGIYDTEINDEFIVHNLEHGQVVISYNLTDSEDLARMQVVAEDLPDLDRWGIVRPYSKIPEGTVAMSAWGVRDQVEGVDEARIKDFYKENRRNRNSGETAELGPIPCG